MRISRPLLLTRNFPYFLRSTMCLGGTRTFTSSKINDDNSVTFSIKNVFIDYATNSQNQWQWLANQYEISLDSKIIEFGCGDALFWKYKAPKLSKENTVLLTDISESRVEKAKSTIDKLATPAHFTFQQRDVYQYPFPHEAEAYDIVMAHSLIFLLDQPETALRIFNFLLKPGGLLSINVLAAGFLTKLFRLGHEINPSAPTQSYTERYSDLQLEPDLKKIFHRVNKFQYKNSLRFTNKNGGAEMAVSLYKNYPNIKPLKFSPAFFTEMTKKIDEEIKEKGEYVLAHEANLYLANK